MADSTITVSAVRKEAKLRPGTPLWKLRKQNGLTLREVAAHTGLNFSTTHKVEQGQLPAVTTALKLARFYETTVEELFGWMLDSPS